MNKHFKISLIKSIIRIIACIVLASMKSLILFAILFLIAELLGILEEIKDERK